MKDTNLSTTRIFVQREADNPVNIQQLLKELRGHYGKLSEVIMELIDNASSVFEKFRLQNGHIDVFIRKQNDGTLHVIVRDNGHGIQDIDAALTLGDRNTALTALSGHGMGFKNLPVEKITLRSVNQNGDAWEVEGPFVEHVNIAPFAGFPDGKCGTELDFVIKGDYLKADIARWGERSNTSGTKYSFYVLCDYLAEHIGVVMGRRMNQFGHTITIYANDGKSKKDKVFKVESLTLEVNPVALMAEAPAVGVTAGSKKIDAFDGNGSITANFKFGYGKPSRKSKRGYFQYNQVSQGWYIFINGRYIGKTHTISAREKHPCLNGLMGWVDLVVDYAEQAPQTEIAKTGFVEASPQYTRLLEEISKLIPNLTDVLIRETKNACVHDIMRDELFNHFVSMQQTCSKEVNVPGGSEQRMDVLNYTNRTMYELKTKAATTKDVFQVLGYVAAYIRNQPMNIPFDTVYICATDFPEPFQAALEDANVLLARDGLEIQTRYLYEVEGIKTLPSAKKQSN